MGKPKANKIDPIWQQRDLFDRSSINFSFINQPN